jgi:hypothetical protein
VTHSLELSRKGNKAYISSSPSADSTYVEERPRYTRWYPIEEIQAESHKVLDTLTEKDFQEAFQNGGDGGTGVYMREGSTSRVMVADRPYGEFYDFYSVSPEYFG